MKLIVIVGPTAIGKTEVAIRLAKKFGGEIVSADSRQIYKELEIGTAKPSPEELAAIPHHFINYKHINEYYSAGKFEKDVMRLISLHKNISHYFLVGGSGLYIQAVCQGIDETPGPDFHIRDELTRIFQTRGLAPLVEELRAADPETAVSIDLKNSKRVIRALEVIRQSGKKFSEIKKTATVKRAFDILKIGLDIDRQDLFDRINHRADLMIEAGLISEAKRLFSQRELVALQTVGYQEFFGYFNGEYDMEEAIRLFKRNSRRYAKRQLTWFKRDPSIQWHSPREITEIEQAVSNFLNSQ